MPALGGIRKPVSLTGWAGIFLQGREGRRLNRKDQECREERNKRAIKIQVYRKEQREEREEIKRDLFLQEWLRESERLSREFKSENYTDDQLSEMALSNGFRTARAYLAAMADTERLLHSFVHDDAFKKLWATLKPHKNSPPYGYARGRGGAPQRLIEAVADWHKAPKFTVAERREHSKKIASACQVLEDLLSQIEPSYAWDMQYSHLRVSDKAQADAIFRIFRTPSFPNDSPIKKTRMDLEGRLEAGGITPIWAVRNIKKMAESGSPLGNILPSKIKAKGAKKTFFIAAVFRALRDVDVFSRERYEVNLQIVADVVQVMSGMDCTSDDVRKARPPNY